MNRFIRNCFFITLGIIIALFLLDFIYTKVYGNAFPRNKTQYILSIKEGSKYDYVFLGSSRVENFIMPSLIKEVTNKEALNLGTPDAKLNDINVYLRLLIDKKVKIKRLFVQIDNNYNYLSSSDIASSQTLPYLRSNTVINNYMQRVDPNYYKNYFIPFYRYAKNDYKLGFREFLAASINKKSKRNFKDGFVPQFGAIKNKENQTTSLPKTIMNSNESFLEIDALCKANNISVTYFCAPYCSNLVSNNYLSKLKVKLPNFKDFSKVIKEDRLFLNCSHLNKDGAEAFTKYFITALDL